MHWLEVGEHNPEYERLDPAHKDIIDNALSSMRRALGDAPSACSATEPAAPGTGAHMEQHRELMKREMKHATGPGLNDSELLEYLIERPLPLTPLGKVAQKLSRCRRGHIS